MINLFNTYFHFFEIPILVLLIVGIFLQISKRGTVLTMINDPMVKYVFITLILFIVSIMLSAINALNSDVIIKAILKWIEVLTIVLFVFIFINSEIKLKIFYWILFLASFLFIIITLFKGLIGEINLYGYRLFPSYESVLSMALLMPFIKKSKIVFILFLISFFAALLSLSRGAWLAIVACMFFSFKFLNKRFKLFFIFLILTIIVVAFIVPLSREVLIFRFSTLFEDSDASNVERLYLYKIAFQAFSDHPILGVGALNFPYYLIHNGLTEGISAEKIAILEPHNSFIQVLAEEGVLGFTFFFSFIMSIGYFLFKKTENLNIKHEYILGLKLFFIVMLFNLMFGYIASQYRFLLALMTGIVLATTRIIQENQNYSE